MHVNVTFRHIGSSDALKRYAEEKTERLAKYLIEPIEVHWVLSVEKIRHIADATITANGVTIKGQEATADLYSAIDKVLGKLEKQVRKHKEKVKNHKFGEGESSRVRYGASETGPPKVLPRIVKMENVFAKPMSIEEATMQMDVIERDFLVFTDSATGNINVLYRRSDGDLGLIETRTK
jgi:putative sigma-54 modulation protein